MTRSLAGAAINRRIHVKRTIAFILPLVVSSVGATTALAQSPADEMQPFHVAKAGADKTQVFGIWKDRIEVLNKITPMKPKPGENGRFTILWKEFKNGGDTIIASILFDTDFHGEGCEPGPSSSTSKQSWATNCPVRIVTITPDGTQNVRTARACWQWFPLRNFDGPAEPDERTYATYDAAKKTVTLRVTAKGKFERSCTRNVKL